jgi:hypothetical protein
MIKILLAPLLLVISQGANAADVEFCISNEILAQYVHEDYANQISQENSELSEITKSDLNKFTFVTVFGSYFPIPTTFALSGSGSLKNDYLRYYRHSNEFLKKPDASDLIGSIGIGLYDEYLKQKKIDDAKGFISKTKIIHKCSYLDLNIEFRSNKLMPKMVSVFIQNESEYMFISDQNPYLWKALLNIQEKLLTK